MPTTAPHSREHVLAVWNSSASPADAARRLGLGYWAATSRAHQLRLAGLPAKRFSGHGLTAAERIARLSRRDPRTGCRVWVGGTSKDGVPSVSLGARTGSPAPAVYAETRGPVPAGKVVKTTCGNRLCVNPDHLTIGPRGRNPRLTRSLIAAIRRLRKAGLTAPEIQARLPARIGQTSIRKVTRGYAPIGL